eukprot:CAMPEP_0197197038 /NCGR_PEP_ID=MMETSP1423-20130617/32664_1 /TAXON_ID=476441 /ORGANISM="Pseudo-nitzschia heimii, Strain UNC1101" /LENGTH=464 /DNA_ID=CAMNT_0042650853 /DNA_START=482 /DNA_END=1876 /DNA_ORIENTATION=-
MKKSSATSQNNSKISPSSSSSASKVNRYWFLDELGNDCLVPLRFIPCDRNNGSDTESDLKLDEDGRAVECETKEVSMKDWINMLEEESPKTANIEQSVEDHVKSKGRNKEEYKHDAENHEVRNKSVIYYLKDWHLQQRYPMVVPRTPPPAPKSNKKDFLLRHQGSSTNQRCHHSECLLYKTPELFGHDLLNSFLTRFTNGDYRFCYWGPVRSFTARHSDVLHSFSWSYNVVGTKRWTFYHSNQRGSDGIGTSKRNKEEIDASSHDDNYCKTFIIDQEAGQTIFVPATWQHKVVNLEETISINHNWITSSNLDLVWDCLLVEMAAIRDELRGWCGGDDDDAQGLDQNMEACENMLRGCIGLDVTGFILMALVGLLEATIELLSLVPLSGTEATPGNDSDSSRGKREQHVFDILRITAVFRTVFSTEDNAPLVQIRSRLAAVLQSEAMAQNVENMVTTLIDYIHID